jgi:putative ABC transport system permease protein
MARTLGAPLPRVRGVSGRIGKENAGRNPKRTAITSVALSIGVCLVVIVAIFAASIRSTVKSQLSNQLADVDLVVDSGTGFAGLGPEPRQFLEDQPEVDLINPIRFNQATLLDSKGAKEEQATRGETDNGVPVGESDFVIGVDRTAIFQIAAIEDLTPKITELPDDEVMVLAKTAEDNGWKPGDRIRVWFPKSGEQTWKIAATFGSRIGNGAEYITNNETQSKNALPEFDVDSTIWVKLNDGVDPKTALAEFKPELKKLAPTAGVNTIGDYVGERLGILDSVVNLIYVLLGLSIVIALVGVGNTISLSIHERTRELGLLRAVGMTRRQLAESVVWESVIIALAGTVIGLAIGVVLGTIFVDGIDQQGVEPVVSTVTVAVIGVLGATAGVFLAIRPALRATRVNVLAAISSV